jgi:hypothetical protein
MPRLELLNSEVHGDLRLGPPVAAEPHFVQIVLPEFASAAACCPILLAKNPETGRFYAGAMFGFRPGENLLIGSGASRAFRPLDVERQGFFASGEEIAVDLDHPRISQDDGEALFDEDGEPAETMQRIQRAIGLLVVGTEQTDAFIRQMVDLRLVEPIDISLRFDDGETLRLDGLYTVSLDSLSELDDEAALNLFRSGYLHHAYTVADSLRQIPVLAHRRNQRLADSSA